MFFLSFFFHSFLQWNTRLIFRRISKNGSKHRWSDERWTVNKWRTNNHKIIIFLKWRSIVIPVVNFTFLIRIADFWLLLVSKQQEFDYETFMKSNSLMSEGKTQGKLQNAHVQAVHSSSTLWRQAVFCLNKFQNFTEKEVLPFWTLEYYENESTE